MDGPGFSRGLADNVTSTILGNATNGVNVSDEVSDRYMDKVMRYFDLYLTIVFATMLTCFALVTSMINIVVLVKQGVRSCVSLCIFCLSVTDFLSTFAGLCNVPAKILMYLNKKPGFDPYALYFFMIFMSAMFYDISNTLTAFLSLERCLCVCHPLKFKGIFTFRRDVAAIVFLCLLCFGLYSPHFLSSGLEWRTSEDGNSTYLGLWLSPDRERINVFISVGVHFCLTTTNLSVVCLCTILMLISLKRSYLFQKRKAKSLPLSWNPVKVSAYKTTESTSALSTSTDGENRTSYTLAKDIDTNRHVASSNPIKNQDLNLNRKKRTNKYQNSRGSKPELGRDGGYIILRKGHSRTTSESSTGSTRNVNVMKTVIALCVICFFSNLPRLIMATTMRLEPRFNLDKEWANWFHISLSIVYTIQLVNCSLNIFVYYKFNRSFRTTFKRVFSCNRGT